MSAAADGDDGEGRGCAARIRRRRQRQDRAQYSAADRRVGGHHHSVKTERREFKTSIRNGHDAPIRVVIEDHVPVSKIDDVKVELLP